MFFDIYVAVNVYFDNVLSTKFALYVYCNFIVLCLKNISNVL